MTATVSALVGATRADEVKVHRGSDDADRPVVVTIETGSIHLSDKAAGALIDGLIEAVHDYAPF